MLHDDVFASYRIIGVTRIVAPIEDFWNSILVLFCTKSMN
jgi:hypothetical protein